MTNTTQTNKTQTNTTHPPRVNAGDSRPVRVQPLDSPQVADLRAQVVADKWSDLVDTWHATAIRALDEHRHSTDHTCTCCGEQWPCAAANNAALALEVHATA